jgi:cytochrome c oxidase subunit 1
MATVTEVLPPPAPPPVEEIERPFLLRRPKSTTGFWSWFTTVDHKKIGILYIMTALGFFIVGGIEALLIRLQLAQPNGIVHDARHHDGVPPGHADGGRPRQLLRAAPDRRA